MARVIASINLWGRGMMQQVRGLIHDAGQLLMPSVETTCPDCGAPFHERGFQVLCLDCYDKLALWDEWRSLPGASTALSAEGAALHDVAALGPYDGALRQIVHRLKFRGERRLGLAFGYLMGALARRSPDARDVDEIVPVPLHPDRRWVRGFNQAHVLAAGVGAVLRRPVEAERLLRERATSPQARLGRRERETNVRGAFGVSPEMDIKGKTVLLVDDVVTTGATLGAAAHALRKRGASRVVGVVLAVAHSGQQTVAS